MRSLSLAFSWTLATAAGFLLAIPLGIGSFLVISAVLGCDVRSALPAPEYCSNTDYVALFLAAVVGGAGPGLVQYAVLRLHQIPIRAGWIVCTSVGFAIPVAFGIGLVPPLFAFEDIAFFSILGISLGAAQWLALRRLSRGGVWILASVVSAVVAGLSSGWRLDSPFTWLVFGAGTALALIWLVRRNEVGGFQTQGG